MERKGIVSIWLGNIEEDDLREYTAFVYDDEGEYSPASFFSDFQIDMSDVDEDFMEIDTVMKGSDRAAVLLQGCSYEESVIPAIEQEISLTKTYNAMILMYNFDYHGAVRSSGVFDFIASVAYIEE